MSSEIYLASVGLTVFISVIISVFVINPIVKSQYAKKSRPDISVEEMIKLEQNLFLFFRENNLEPGDSVWKVANVLRVKDGGSVDNINGRARIYELDTSGNKLVVHNKKVPHSEHLFDFAHELGHQINGDPVPANRPTGYNKPKMEQLADYTGAALLMPLDHVYEFLINNNYDSSPNRKRIALIRKLSRQYGVSEMITVRRVNEVRKLKRANI